MSMFIALMIQELLLVWDSFLLNKKRKTSFDVCGLCIRFSYTVVKHYPMNRKQS